MSGGAHQYEDKLLELAYGELPAHEAAAVEAHVKDCARCSADLTQLRAVRRAMSELPLEPAPEAGLESLLAYAEATAKRNAAASAGRGRLGWRRLLMPLTSMAALLLVGVVAWRASRDFDPDPVQVALAQKKQEAPPAERRPRMPSSYGESARDLREAEAEADADADASKKGEEGVGRAEAEKPALGGGALPGPRSRTASKMKAPPRGDLGVGLLDAAPSPPPPAGPSPLSKAAAPAKDTDVVSRGKGGMDMEQDDAASQRAPVPMAEEAAESKVAVEKKSRLDSEALATAVPVQSEKTSGVGQGADTKRESYGVGGFKAGGNAYAGDSVGSAGRAELDQARAAGASGDRNAEVKYALDALESGVSGGARREALERLCTAWEALGDARQAETWCDRLLAEFPKSALAQRVATRRQKAKVAAEPAEASPLERPDVPVPASAGPSR